MGINSITRWLGSVEKQNRCLYCFSNKAYDRNPSF